jgi:sterol desaturase/sphingolipid hydroxylase (fatty acid hydroxylase superfamily)
MFKNFIGNSVALAIIAVVISIALGVLWALPVMWIWDYIMPTMFGLPEITWFKAWLLYILCNILFKSHYSREK